MSNPMLSKCSVRNASALGDQSITQPPFLSMIKCVIFSLHTTSYPNGLFSHH